VPAAEPRGLGIAYVPSWTLRRQGAADGLHAVLDPVDEPKESVDRLGRAEVAVAVPVVALLPELARVPCLRDNRGQALFMGERHVRVERRVEGQNRRLQDSGGLVERLEVVGAL